MKILITNDDGIHSPGLLAVVQALKGDAECLVVAPHEQCSAMGHSITLYEHIAVEEVDLNHFKGYSIEGTPADCVKFAIGELAKDRKLDLIISGINLGLNTGVSVYYSGTVSAAREGMINGIPSIAISQAREQLKDFSFATDFILDLVQGHRQHHLPKDTLLNVNIPHLSRPEIKGIRVTKQAHSRFVEWFEAHEHISNGKKKYSIFGDIEMINPDGTSDEEALRLGYAAITPLKLDMTHYERLSDIQTWMDKKKPS